MVVYRHLISSYVLFASTEVFNECDSLVFSNDSFLDVPYYWSVFFELVTSIALLTTHSLLWCKRVHRKGD